MEAQIRDCGFYPEAKVGHGSYGIVWGVIEPGTDPTQSHKIYKYISSDDDRYGLPELREVDLSRRIHHPYLAHADRVLTPLDCQIDGVVLLFEKGDRGELFDYLLHGNRLTFRKKLEMMYQLCLALDFLHRNKIYLKA